MKVYMVQRRIYKMDKKKFAIVSTTLNDHTFIHIYDVDQIKEWIHGHSNVLNRMITPLVYLADGPDNPVEESTLDVSYHIEFQEFIGEVVEDEKTFQLGDTTVTLSKTILNDVIIDTGIEPDQVTNNEYKLWHNDRCQFIEVAYKGFKHSPNNNPALTLIYDGQIKPSVFVNAILKNINK